MCRLALLSLMFFASGCVEQSTTNPTPALEEIAGGGAGPTTETVTETTASPTPAAQPADAEAAPVTPPIPEGLSDPVEILRAHVAEVAQRSEHSAPSLKVQHILIGHAGAGLPGVGRPIGDAEQLAADTYLELVNGADFTALKDERSDDQPPGIYGMFMGEPVPGYMPRKRMVDAFGFVAWRLEVGQIGVAALDPKRSPYGWHIVQRIE